MFVSCQRPFPTCACCRPRTRRGWAHAYNHELLLPYVTPSSCCTAPAAPARPHSVFLPPPPLPCTRCRSFYFATAASATAAPLMLDALRLDLRTWQRRSTWHCANWRGAADSTGRPLCCAACAHCRRSALAQQAPHAAGVPQAAALRVPIGGAVLPAGLAAPNRQASAALAAVGSSLGGAAADACCAS